VRQREINREIEKDTDIDIAVLYHRVYGDAGHASARDMQMKLAPIFATINEKLTRGLIEPGNVKRTYRYSSSKGK